MSARDDITVYWGVSSGSSHAAMHRHYEGAPRYQDGSEPTHLMINWRTENNQVWEGPTWMIDSGGAPDTIIANQGHPDTVHDYLDYVDNPPTKYGDHLADVDLEYFALRDWPCEPVVQQELGLDVEELQHRTLIDHINLMNAYEDRNIDAEPMAVLQGWGVHDYLEVIDAYKDHGLITDKIAIGTLCGRQDTHIIRTTSWRIARNLPSRCNVHGFGVKTSSLREPDALRIFGSVDTAAWDQSLRHATKTGVESGPPGGTYDDWIDRDDDGNPRYTARNMWLSYRGYARRMGQVEPVKTPTDVEVVTLDEFAPGMRADEYIVAQCPSGQILDPGRPEPLMGDPQDRFCERSELNIQMRRIHLQDQLMMGPAEGEEGPVPGSEGAFRKGHGTPAPGSLEQYKEVIHDRMERDDNN
jgi:hypothetical protein